MTLYELFKNHKNRKRLEEIVHIFFEEEFGYFISKINLHYHLPFHKRIKAKIAQEKTTSHPIRLRRAFERLGPTFIKFGQLLSLRPDLVPPEFIAEFEKMQDCVPPFPYPIAKKIIESEFKKPLDKIFTVFPKKPIASASISQVYRAKIGNKEVAVKVQRPGIRQQIEDDIELMYQIAELLESHFPELKAYHLMGIIHEFERWTLKELNFEIEACFAQRIAKNFKNSNILKIPQIYTKFSTDKVLVMEFINGIPLHDIERIKKAKINIKKVIRNGYSVMLRQIFVDGFFHADPHPGNILVLKNGKIAFIDFGIIGHFDKKLKNFALDLFHSFVNNDPDRTVDIFLKMNPNSDVDREVFREAVRDIFEHLQCSSFDNVQVGPLLRETLSLVNKHHLKIPEDFVLYGKTVSIIEGIALRYQPDFDFEKESKVILGNLMNYKFFAKEVIDRTHTNLSKYKDLAESFPDTAREILEKAKKFKLNIDLEDADISSLTFEIERSSGNLALGLIVAALIVGSSLIMQTSALTYVYVGGFIIAGVLGLWLVHRTVFVKKIKGDVK